MVQTSDAWIRERTGVCERRIAPAGIVTSDMAAAAATAALDAASLAATDLDLIVVATVTPDMPMPATAVFVQQKIHATCPAFDLSAACAGFIYGLAIGDSFICAGSHRHVLVIGVELLSRAVDWNDRTTCVLFGDGAGAVVLGPAKGGRSGVLSTKLMTDGSLARALMIPSGGSVEPITHQTIEGMRHKVHMRGKDIFRVAVKNLWSASVEALDEAAITVDELDWVCAHQANLRILNPVMERLGVRKDKVLVNIDRVGNTSSASIPILLDENLRAGRIKPHDTVLMCALGAGISWGSALVRI
jgi:3-oxoacyl-[acyl-carrier-protein] synthase-3